MIGAVIIWPHSIASIPSNWHLCDGTHGTVDLRGFYLSCAEDEGDVGGMVGTDTQNHTFEGDGHLHAISLGPPNQIQIGIGFDNVVLSSKASGTTDNADNKPLTKKYPFIQRIA